MLEYLDSLMQDGNWKRSQEYAEQLLRQRDLDEVQIARIHAALCCIRVNIGDFPGSAIAGQIALSQAERLCLWDLYAGTCLDLSATYHRMGDLGDAENVIYCLLRNLDMYSKPVWSVETMAWYNLGTIHSAMEKPQQAAEDFTYGLKAASRGGLWRHAHGIRQALIEVYLRLESFDKIPPLLAKCAHYLRNADNHLSPSKTSLWFHYRLRIEFAMATGRIRRARLLALRALTESEGECRHQFTFHMQLARLAERAGSAVEAVGHSTAAKVYATQCRRFDLEAQATDFVYAVTARHPENVARLNEYYYGLLCPQQEDGQCGTQ